MRALKILAICVATAVAGFSALIYVDQRQHRNAAKRRAKADPEQAQRLAERAQWLTSGGRP